MPLQVIGTGFGRTGTLSLKLALEALGFGPCYHMLEVIPRPDHVALWTRAGRGEAIDWDALFAGFSSTVDWPSTRFWRELIARYPDARVIHTTREPASWAKSFDDTIATRIDSDEPPPAHLKDWLAMVRLLLREQTFGGRMRDRDRVIEVFKDHDAEVRRTIPASRRLDYDVREGWAPLCEFLNVPVPDAPFPKTNTTDEFQARAAALRNR